MPRQMARNRRNLRESRPESDSEMDSGGERSPVEGPSGSTANKPSSSTTREDNKAAESKLQETAALSQ